MEQEKVAVTVAVLEVENKQQQKTLDDHENRIRGLEEWNGVVSNLKESVEKQGENIDKVVDMVYALKAEEAKTFAVYNFICSLNWKKVLVGILLFILFILALIGIKENYILDVLRIIFN